MLFPKKKRGAVLKKPLCGRCAMPGWVEKKILFVAEKRKRNGPAKRKRQWDPYDNLESTEERGPVPQGEETPRGAKERDGASY